MKLADAIKTINPIEVKWIIETNPQPVEYCEQQINHFTRPMDQRSRPQEEIDQLITAYTVLRAAILSKEIGTHNVTQLIAYIDAYNHMAAGCKHQEGTYTGLYYFDEYGAQWYMVASPLGEFETTGTPKPEPLDLTNAQFVTVSPYQPIDQQVGMMLG